VSIGGDLATPDLAVDLQASTLPLEVAAEVPLDGDRCQRWNQRAHSWRRRSEGGFDARRYAVAPVDEATAKRFVLTHHYSRSYPAARSRWGIFEGPELVGVAVLSVPVRAEVCSGVFPGLVPIVEALELGRFVLLDPVPANAESWFLARVLKRAAAEGIRGVVSFSDPVPRRAVTGELTCPGHVGTIYAASGARYLGRGRDRTLRLLPDGRVLHDRAIAKVLAGHRGREYVERILVEFGAPSPRVGESAEAWLARALPAAGVRLLRHPGNHRYALVAASNRAEARAVRAMLRSGGPYPKQIDTPDTLIHLAVA
jgi:hypothetical protein